MGHILHNWGLEYLAESSMLMRSANHDGKIFVSLLAVISRLALLNSIPVKMATTLINSDDSRYCVGSELLADGGLTQTRSLILVSTTRGTHG